MSDTPEHAEVEEPQEPDADTPEEPPSVQHDASNDPDDHQAEDREDTWQLLQSVKEELVEADDDDPQATGRSSDDRSDILKYGGESIPRALLPNAQASVKCLRDARQWALELAELGRPLNVRARWCVDCNRVQRDGVSHKTVKKDHTCLFINPDFPVHYNTGPSPPAQSAYTAPRARDGFAEDDESEVIRRPALPATVLYRSRHSAARYVHPEVPLELAKRQATPEEHDLMPCHLKAAHTFFGTMGKCSQICSHYVNAMRRLYLRDGWSPDYMVTEEYYSTIRDDPINKAHSGYPCSALKLFAQYWYQRQADEDLPQDLRRSFPMYGSRGAFRGRGVFCPPGMAPRAPVVKRQRITELSPEEALAEEAAQASQGQDAASQLLAARLAAAQAARASAMLQGQDTDVYPEEDPGTGDEGVDIPSPDSDGEGPGDRASGSQGSQGMRMPLNPNNLSSMVVSPAVAAMMPPGWDILAAAPPKKPFSETHLTRLREASKALWAHRHGIGPQPVTAAAKALAKRKNNAAKIARMKAQEAAAKKESNERREETRRMRLLDKEKQRIAKDENRKQKEEYLRLKKEAMAEVREATDDSDIEQQELIKKKEALAAEKLELERMRESAARKKREAATAAVGASEKKKRAIAENLEDIQS